MPELPDVEIWKRYVDAHALHQRIDEAKVRAPRMLKGVTAARLRHELDGRRFTHTRRYGK